MSTRRYWSQRQGRGPSAGPLPFERLRDLLVKVIERASLRDLFAESFGQECSDEDDGWIEGKDGSIEDRILLDLHRDDLWPTQEHSENYDVDALYDLIEFLYDHASKPVDGPYHSFYGHHHWSEFDREAGQGEFRRDVNRLLERADPAVNLHQDGHIRLVATEGFEQLVEADLPLGVPDRINERIASAVFDYRQSRSVDDLRHAVRDLADALEALRKDVRVVLQGKDESDLFMVLNSYGIRHLNDSQRTDYDALPYLRWLFYVLLATVHLTVRIRDRNPQG